MRFQRTVMERANVSPCTVVHDCAKCAPATRTRDSSCCGVQLAAQHPFPLHPVAVNRLVAHVAR